MSFRHDLGLWQHAHDFGTSTERHAERRTRWVVALTVAAMVLELGAGWFTGSMALLADGWHMGTHAAALGLSAYAYAFARRHARNRRYTFGTGKVSNLAGYSSALLLALAAIWMAVESVERLLQPVSIRYQEAMLVAAFGLAVNLFSAWLLGHDPHGHDHEHHHGHVDHNLCAAYLHVIADALTSVLALAALAAGMWLGWAFLDPLMGIAGALLISRWAWLLARDCTLVLLDAEDHGAMEAEVRAALAADPDVGIADLHLWRVGPMSHACIVSLVTHRPQPVEHYRGLLARLHGVDHLTVEVHQCRDERCLS